MKVKKKIKPNKDGSEDWTIDISKEEIELIKQYYDRKRYSKKLLTKAIIEGIRNYLENATN